jgi:hypothetical protein
VLRSLQIAVQFLDFGLTPQDTASNGRFVRKTANGPLLRLDYDLVNGAILCLSLAAVSRKWLNLKALSRYFSH